MNALPEHTPYERYPIKRPTYREPVVEYKPEDKCACGCGKWAADGFYTEHNDYVYSKECYIKISLENGWIKQREAS